MKIKFLMTCLLGCMAATAFAQKGELNTAQEEYDKFDKLRGGAMAALSKTSLNTAKTSIDKAAVNEKTAALPQTLALKGAIYANLALADTVAATSTPLYATADEALKKAKDADTKKEQAKLIDAAYRTLAQYNLNKGIREYSAKQYDQAYKSFDNYRIIMPEDTNAIYYTGLAAANASLWDPAISNYTKLLTTNFTQKARTYQDLSNFYLYKKDTTGAIKVMTEASQKFPNDAALSKRVIELNLQTGKQQEVLNNMEKAIANDPKNKTLYYYAGLTYSQVADDAAKKLTKAAPTAQPALAKTRDESLTKAQDMYKKALDLDANYFEANLNMGYVLITPAIDVYNAANKLPVNKQKEYDAAMAKANTMFDAAKPYLQKAVDLKPTSIDALTNLRTYYLGKKDIANANKIKQQIDALQQGGGK